MREVGQFVGGYHAIDDNRTFGLERLVDDLAQLARLLGLEAHGAAGARQRRKVWVGEFDGLFRKPACPFLPPPA